MIKPSARRRRVLFLTGTRADFGKLKTLIAAVEADADFEAVIFVTGMHTLERFGYTVNEVRSAGFKNVYVYANQILGEPMDLVLANTIHGLGRYVHDSAPDLIVVHGDRVEALAGAIVGALRNIRTAHIEGGELSGTVDGLVRHAVSKLAHIHFVANDEAAGRLVQMGERKDTIYVIGSPDIDVMLSQELPSIDEVRQRYEIPFQRYAIALFHPVTSEIEDGARHATAFVDALLESAMNYVVIYPNNDRGTDEIMAEYERLRSNPRFRLLPSMRFESFIVALRHASLIVGNSSAGIREAPVFGVPSLNVGTRQQDRHQSDSILNVGYGRDQITKGIREVLANGPQPRSEYFGTGNSSALFMEALHSARFWEHDRQKPFVDLREIVGAGAA